MGWILEWLGLGVYVLEEGSDVHLCIIKLNQLLGVIPSPTDELLIQSRQFPDELVIRNQKEEIVSAQTILSNRG